MFGESISSYLRFIRLPWLLFLIAAAGRLVLGTMDVPYSKGTWFFSIVTLTFHLCIVYGALSKKLRGYRLPQALVLGILIALSAQVIILVLTVASYALNAETYFNHPLAIAGTTEYIPFGEALKARLLGLVENSLMGGNASLLGWLAGGLIPGSVDGGASTNKKP